MATKRPTTIAAYIRALQRSQFAPKEELTAEDRRRLEGEAR